MAEDHKCSYNNCLNEALHSCECNSEQSQFCDSHVLNHLRVPSLKGHNILSLYISIDQKYIDTSLLIEVKEFQEKTFEVVYVKLKSMSDHFLQFTLDIDEALVTSSIYVNTKNEILSGILHNHEET